MKKYQLSLFIFRRDLRLDDNTGLIAALKESDKVIPIFIFTPEQVTHNKYKSDRCVQFMIESLLDIKIKIYMFYGKTERIINNLIEKLDINAVYLNQDYTPYSIERDKKIKRICDKNKIDFNSYEDLLLHPVLEVKTDSGEIYQKFTPYYRKAVKKEVRRPVKNSYTNYYNKKITGVIINLKQFYISQESDIHGGRRYAKNILKNIKKFKDYNKSRDELSYQTTQLSAYNKFGCVSIREVYYTIKDNLTRSDLIKQLYWRDFYYNIIYDAPYVLESKNYNDKYNKIRWITWEKATDENRKLFQKWCKGETGYPIVDAGMRELNNTGFMHNRARLIVASFLTKLLFWHWKDGERYFAQKLIDYDPSQNNGNWQWCSGSGVDAQPYYRIFNPWTQSIKHDYDCKYIKKWIPELKNIDNEDIHKWYICYDKYDVYIEPIIDYQKKREECLKKMKF